MDTFSIHAGQAIIPASVPAPEVGEVGLMLKALEDEVEEASSLLLTIAAKLKPILIPVCAGGTGDGGFGPVEDLISPLHSDINRVYDNIEICIGVIDELIQNVDAPSYSQPELSKEGNEIEEVLKPYVVQKAEKLNNKATELLGCVDLLCDYLVDFRGDVSEEATMRSEILADNTSCKLSTQLAHAADTVGLANLGLIDLKRNLLI